MNLIIFAVFMALSVLFIVINIFGRSPLLGIVGFTIMFLLGLVVINDELLVQNGETVLTNYTYDNETYNETTINFTNQTTTNSYISLDEKELHIYGYLLAILGAFGFVLLLFELPQSFKNTYKEVKEDLHK